MTPSTSDSRRSNPQLPQHVGLAASLIQRKWSHVLGDALSWEDLYQQAYLYFLEGLGTPPEGVDTEVWHVGKLTNKLNTWCRKLYYRYSRELPLGLRADYEDGNDRLAMIDALDLAETVCTPGELACVYFKAAGYREDRAEELLGISKESYHTRLSRLRQRMKNHASRN